MIRRPLRVLRQFVCALLVIGLGLGAGELLLLTREAASRSARSIDPRDSRFFLRSPQTHHELRPGTILRTRALNGDESVTVRVNSFGLRGPEPVVPKPDGVYRILLLGDDTIFGAGIPEEQTVAARLQQQLQPATATTVEVINAGVPGYCPLLSCLQFRHRLTALQPDLVILHFDMSDVSDDRFFRRYATVGPEGQHLVCGHPALCGGRITPHAGLVEKCALGRWCQQQLRGSGQDSACPTDDLNRYAWLRDVQRDGGLTRVRHTLQPVSELRELVEQVSAHFLLITSPVPWQVAAVREDHPLGPRFGFRSGSPPSAETPFQILSDYSASQQIDFASFVQLFEDESDAPLFAERVPRLSSAGHARLASGLANYILAGARREAPPPSRDIPPTWASEPSPPVQHASGSRHLGASQ